MDIQKIGEELIKRFPRGLSISFNTDHENFYFSEKGDRICNDCEDIIYYGFCKCKKYTVASIEVKEMADKRKKSIFYD